MFHVEHFMRFMIPKARLKTRYKIRLANGIISVFTGWPPGDQGCRYLLLVYLPHIQHFCKRLKIRFLPRNVIRGAFGIILGPTGHLFQKCGDGCVGPFLWMFLKIRRQASYKLNEIVFILNVFNLLNHMDSPLYISFRKCRDGALPAADGPISCYFLLQTDFFPASILRFYVPKSNDTSIYRCIPHDR